MKWSEVIALKKQQNSQVEKQWAQSLLVETHGNVSHAARIADMDRSNFLRILRDNGLFVKEYR
jgi:transcriptional regulator of acetoin/glycerol metabolism